MRQDMKDLLVNTGRAWLGYEKRSVHWRAQVKRADPDALPTRIHRRREKSQTDRLNPLHRFLEKKCGRSWNKVFSEIVKSADYRSLRGHHLLEHVKGYVRPTPFDIDGYRSYGPFFVDRNGLLQKELRRRHTRPKDKTNPLLRESPDHWYEKIKGLWYEFTTTHRTFPQSREDLALIDGEVQIIRVTLEDGHESKTSKRQVDNKAAKRIETLLSGS